MYRLDKIDSQLAHVVPAVDRFGAAAGNDPGAMLAAYPTVPGYISINCVQFFSRGTFSTS
jgi:hypothetical protein